MCLAAILRQMGDGLFPTENSTFVLGIILNAMAYCYIAIRLRG
jgi:hypothetical protein